MLIVWGSFKDEGHYILWAILKMVYPFKVNASYVVWTLAKICIFLKKFEPSEGHYIQGLFQALMLTTIFA